MYRKSPRAALSTRAALLLALATALVIALGFIWKFHVKYFGARNPHAGWGSGNGNNDDVSFSHGWLPEELITGTGAAEGSREEPPSMLRRKTGNYRKGKADRRKAPTEAQFATKPKISSSANDRNPAAEPDRVYCMVPFIWTPSALDTYHAIRASWGKRCHMLRFFIDPVTGDEAVGFYNMTEGSGVAAARKAGLNLPGDVVVLHDMKRPWHTCGSEENEKKNKPVGNCRNIFEKIWRMIVYVSDDADNGSAEWFVKVDSDTFLFPENVGRYVKMKNWSHHEPHYFGHVLNHRKSDRGVSIVAGGAVFFSRSALFAAGDAFRTMPLEKGDEEEDGTCQDAYTGTEEVVTAVCLKEHSNIVAEPAVDSEGREEVSLYEIDNILGYNRTDQGEWWFWEGKKKFPCHDEGDCLASLPLAFHHYKDCEGSSAGDCHHIFLDFEKEFHGSVMKGEHDEALIKKKDGRVAARHWPSFDRTHRYFEKVRAAMNVAEMGEPHQNNYTIAARRRNTLTKMKEQSKRKKLPSNSKRKTSAMQPTRADSSKSSTPNRVYCMVPFIWTPSALNTYHAIHDSWGKRCHLLRFFIDPVIGDKAVGFYNMTEASEVVAAKKANLILPDDVVVLHDMKRPWHTCGSEENEKKNKPVGNCRNIFEKVWRMIVYVGYGLGGANVADSKISNVDGRTDAYSAEWFVKVDSDTFLFPENVGRYVEAKNWSHNEPHYFGHVLNHRKSDRGVSIVAGGAVFFSRSALLAAGDAFRKMPLEKGDKEEDGTCRDAYTGTEEVVTAVCLKEHSDIVAEPAVDSEGREEVSLYEVDDLLRYNRTDQGEWWFWEGKEKFPCHDEGDCLAPLPLAFHHYKDCEGSSAGNCHHIFLDFEKEFHGSVMKGEKDETLIRKKDGRVAARHWPNFDRTHRYFESVRAAMRSGGHPQYLTRPNATKSENLLYCMVPFIWTPKYVPSYHAIRKTWGKRCDVLKFMIDPIVGDDRTGFKDLRADGVDYKVPDDVVIVSDIQRPWNVCPHQEEGNCRNIWEKVWRSWVWVDAHGDSDLADWFVKIDADSFLFPDNFKRYVQHRGWVPEDHHYFGHILKHKIDEAAPMIAGAAVFFSRATLKGAARIFRNFETAAESDDNRDNRWECKDAYLDQEEAITSICLKEYLGVDATPALDDVGQELVTVGEIEDVLLWNRTEQGEWWYWKNKQRKHPETGREMHHCCGDLPIAFHGYKDPQWFYKIENEFYNEEVSGVGNHWKKYQWRNPIETKQYFDRVRNAMNDASNNG